MDYERGSSIAVRFPQLMVLAIGWDVLISALAGMGIYYGIFSHHLTIYGEEQAPGSSIQFALPYLLPSLDTVKMPYTFLLSEGIEIGFVYVFAIIILILMQNFVTGMYLGGIKQAILIDDPAIVHERTLSPLLPAGKKYLARLTGWSALFWIIFVPLMVMLAVVWPIVLLVMFGLMFFMLTPYLIVMKDIPLSEALGLSPRLFARYFGKLLPIAIISALLVAFCGLLGFLPRPYQYIIVMLAISFFGTAMNAAFMIRLGRLMAEDALLPGYWTGSRASETASHVESPDHPENVEDPDPPNQPDQPERVFRKWRWRLAILLLPLLGAFFASGHHLLAFSPWEKKEWTGISIIADSSFFYAATDQNYFVYEWDEQPVKIMFHSPDITGEKEPRTITGIAKITRDVDQDKIVRNGNSTHHMVEPVETQNTFFYRLHREGSEQGNPYYSTRAGTAGMIYWEEPGREPLNLEMMIGGHGENIFVVQYPARFAQKNYQPMFGGQTRLPELLRVSNDGRLLLPEPSRINPGDFKYYWFKESFTVKDIFAMIAAKNEKINLHVRNDQLPNALAVALKEADGDMVVRIMRKMAEEGIKLDVPDWSAEEWTRYLREQYQGLSMPELFKYLNKVTEIHESTVISPKKGDTCLLIHVLYPQNSIKLLFSEKQKEITGLEIQFEFGKF